MNTDPRLDWLEANIRGFKEMRADVLKVQREQEENRAKFREEIEKRGDN